MSRAITQRDRKACIRAHARAGAWRYGHGRETQSRGGSLDGIIYVAPAPYVTAKVPGSNTEAPPPKSLEVEPGSQDDVYEFLDDVIAHHQWMM